MPTKTENTIDWGSGTLYIIPQEGGDPVPIGPVKGLTETIEREHLDGADLPAPLTTSLTQTLTFEAELESLNPKAMFFLTGDPSYMARWAVVMRPRLAHLARYAKKGRARKKNVHRLVAFMIEELKR